MASEKTDAIVLRLTPWSDSSAIVTFLTRDFGRVSALAKGAFRLKGPFEAALDLLTHSRIVFIPKSADVLDLLTEAKLVRRFRSAQTDLLRLNCGYYVAELILAMTEPGQTMAELFDWVDSTLECLDAGLPPAEVTLRFELQTLRLLGHLPSFDVCVGCGERLKVNSTVHFGVIAGGGLCMNCVSGQRMVLRLRRETIEILTGFSQPTTPRTASELLEIDPKELDMIPVECRAETRGCMNRYLTQLLERKFKLHPHLKDLAR